MGRVFTRHSTVFAIVACVCVSLLVFSGLSGRRVLLVWAMFCVIALPVVFWRELGFRKWAISLLAAGVILSLSPIDLAAMKTGKPGLQFRPAHYGYRCPPGALCYGCFEPPFPVRGVVVISY